MPRRGEEPGSSGSARHVQGAMDQDEGTAGHLIHQASAASTSRAADVLSGSSGPSAEGVAKLIFGADIEMVHFDAVRDSNAKGDRLRGLVAVFVGGTGGIGESTARELFARATRPRAYIVGRSDGKGKALAADLERLNPDGEAIFLQRDISLLRTVDELCAELARREDRVNCLFLTAGYMTLRGRDQTDEGLDKKMVVNYYARMRCIVKMMPLLTAASDAGQLSRVITVLAAGSESDIRLDDLDLRRKYTLHACLAHCVLMTDFMVEEFARRFPGTSFSHSYPGTVKTGLVNELSGPIRLAVKVMYAVMTPWVLNVQESGARHFFQMTSRCYPAADGGVGIDVPSGLNVMRGSNGTQGSGAYLLDWDGKPTGDERLLQKYRDLGFGSTAWDHTFKMFEQVDARSRSSSEKRPPDDSPEGSGRRSAPHPPTDDPIGWRPG